MECFLPAKHLRCAITTFCFGCVFLWILSGQYLDRQHRHSDASSSSRGRGGLAAAGGHPLHLRAARRRLLEAEEAMEKTRHHNTNNNSAGSSGNTYRTTYNPSTAQVSKYVFIMQWFLG